MEFKDKLLDTYIAFEEELGPKDSIQKLTLLMPYLQSLLGQCFYSLEKNHRL